MRAKSPITREQAETLATNLRERCESLPEDAGEGLESKTWDAALDVLLGWAREVADDVDRSRSLLALASWLVGQNKQREKKHREALEDPALALKCEECGADQDAWGSTCSENEKHYDACGWCEVCPDCVDEKTWVRPGKDERLTNGGKWEKPKKPSGPISARPRRESNV